MVSYLKILCLIILVENVLNGLGWMVLTFNMIHGIINILQINKDENDLLKKKIEILEKELTKKLQDKIKLFRVIHGVYEVYISKEGQLFVEKPNNFSGKWLWWYKNGQLRFEDNWKNGKLHGKCLDWYETGQLAYEENYKNGKEHGKCLAWFENGQLMYERNYKNEEKHGQWLVWYENGQLLSEFNYKNGKRID